MGIRVDQNILNQKGTPAFNAAPFSARPTAGFLGRIFISTDTYEIFRDESVGWSLIADAGAGSGTLESVTFNGNNTPYGINITNGGLFLLGSTNGSIFFASGGSGQFTTDSTNFFWDDTNNRLGIGTAVPSARLDVHSSSGTSAILNGTGVSNALLTFQSAGVNKWSVGNFVSSTVANDFNIYDAVNTVSRLQVHNTGVVNIPTSLIIGTTTPTSIYSLDVTGSGRFTSALLASSTITGSSFIPTGATVPTNGMYLSAANTLAFSTNSTNQLSIASTGLASFNYNTSGTALKITTSYASGRVVNFGFGDGTVLPTAAFYIGNQTGVGVFIGDETTTNGLYVKSNGSVGIGTQTPTAAAGLAFVLYSGASQGRICIKTSATGDASGDGLQIGMAGSDAFIEQRENADLTFATNASERLRIGSAGAISNSGAEANVSALTITANSTSGQSFGLKVKGGTTSGDTAFLVQNVGGSTDYFRVRGDGQVNAGAYTYANAVGTPRTVYIDSAGTLGGISSILASKTNIKEFNPNWLYDLKPVQFNYRKKDINEQYTDEFDNELYYGLIAEETELVNKEICTYNNEKLIGIEYSKLVPILVKAVQELNEKLIRNNIN